MKIFALCFLTLISLHSRADILFLDFNNAPGEYEAAKAAALQRHEKVIRIPQVSDADLAAQQKALQTMQTAMNDFRTQCQGATKASNCPALQVARDQAVAAADNMIQPAKDQLRKGLKAQMAKLEQQGTKISSVVISGHDGNGLFSGEYGDLTADQIKDALSAAPKATKDTRSVLLWGCYTTTLDSIEDNWRSVFPNVDVFAGFDGRGPSKIRPDSHSYLQDFLIQDQALIDATDNKTVRGTLKKIDGFYNTRSAILLRQCMISPQPGKAEAQFKTEAQLRAECAAVTPDLKKGLAVYKCYYEATDPKCANPPDNTDKSDLRDFYNLLQSRSYCTGTWSDEEKSGIPDLQSVQSLIFYNNLKANLGAIHDEDLAKVDQYLQNLGAPPNLKVSDLDRLSRADMIKRLNAIQDFLNNADPGPDLQTRSVQYQQVQGAVTELQGVLQNFQTTPPTWHDVSTDRDSGLDSIVSAQGAQNILILNQANIIRQNHVQDFNAAKQGLADLQPKLKAAQNNFDQWQATYASFDQDGPQKEAASAAVDQAVKQLNAVKSQVKSQVVPQMVQELTSEMNQKKQARQLTPLEEQGYLQAIADYQSLPAYAL